MAYTLADIRDRVQTDKLDDTGFDPDIIDGFINDTQRLIFNTYELGFQEKIFAGTMSAGGYIYTFPSDYQQAQSMVIAGANNFKKDLTECYVDFRDFNAMYPTPQFNDEGAPSVWTIYEGKIFFDRPTDQDYNLSLFYLKTPDELDADADVPEIPEEFQEVLVLGAYYRCLGRNEDFDQAAYVKNNEYQPQVDLMVARLGKKQTGNPTTMRLPRVGGTRRATRS